jgi:hypothetical protein
MTLTSRNYLTVIASILCTLALSHCGGAIENTQSKSGTSPSTSATTDATAILFSTDFSSPGELLSTTTDIDSLSVTEENNSALGSDGTLVADDDGNIHVVHSAFSSLSSDNITTLDPSNSFATTSQTSTGNGTNPTDAVVSGTTAYISLYNGDSDSTNVDASGNPADLLVMDLSTGTIGKRLSFFDFTANDGDRHANASKMVAAGTDLFVLMQDLNSDFSVTAPGQIVVVDTTSNAISTHVELEGRNPVDIAISESTDCLFVANMAEFSFTTFTNDTSTAFGGVETVCHDSSGITVNTLIDDASLGGYVEKVAVSDTTGKLYAVVSNLNANFEAVSKIASFDIADLAAGQTTPAFAIFFDPGADIRDLAFDPDGNLWVADRTINTSTHAAEDPHVSILDAADGSTLGGFTTDLPVTSIAFVE